MTAEWIDLIKLAMTMAFVLATMWAYKRWFE